MGASRAETAKARCGYLHGTDAPACLNLIVGYNMHSFLSFIDLSPVCRLGEMTHLPVNTARRFSANALSPSFLSSVFRRGS